MKRNKTTIDLNKRYDDLTSIEKVAFYHNVQKTTYRYICKSNVYSDLAYTAIDDAYIKGIKTAKKDVNLRSLRSYIGTIAWHMYNLARRNIDKNIQYYERVEQDFDIIDDPFRVEDTQTDKIRYVFKNLENKDRQTVRDMIATNVDYNKLQNIWDSSYIACRNRVFKVRRKVSKILEQYKQERETS